MKTIITYAANKDYPMPKSDYIPDGCLTEAPGRHIWKNWEAYSVLFMENLWKY